MAFTRYPDAPKSFNQEQREAWETLVRLLVQKDFNDSTGNPNTINTEKVKNGAFLKGFTTVSSSPYYVKSGDGILLVQSSLSAISIFLTTAASSNYKTVAIKKIDGGTNAITITDPTGASIDTSASFSFNNQFDSYTLVCDGKAWWII